VGIRIFAQLLYLYDTKSQAYAWLFALWLHSIAAYLFLFRFLFNLFCAFDLVVPIPLFLFMEFMATQPAPSASNEPPTTFCVVLRPFTLFMVELPNSCSLPVRLSRFSFLNVSIQFDLPEAEDWLLLKEPLCAPEDGWLLLDEPLTDDWLAEPIVDEFEDEATF
jgi:hypothetical protein